ncbi:hypothetical protein ACXYJE_001642, partial [Campylobacter jejuni]
MALLIKKKNNENCIKNRVRTIMLDYEKFQTMSKEEYFKKYNVGIRFLFGCDINQKNETEMISLRVFLPKKHFQEYKNIDIFKTMDLFKETLLFKGLTEQSI